MDMRMKRKIRWAIALSLLLVMALGVVGTVNAAEFPKGETIPAGETIDDDVFISGENVIVDGTINGNLFASGQTVTLNGWVSGEALLMGERVVVGEGAVVTGNLFIAGANLEVNGQVHGSVFGGAASMLFGENANAERNFYYGGYSLQTEPGSRVGKDLYAGGYQMMLDGVIERNLGVGAAAVELGGQVGRNARINVGQVERAEDPAARMRTDPFMGRYVTHTIQPGIRFTEGAMINGQLIYTSSIQQIDGMEDAVAGNVIYQTPAPHPTQAPEDEAQPFRRGFPDGFLWGAALLNIARTFIRLMVLGALALWLLPKPFQRLVDAANADALKAFGWGFMIIAVGFMAVLIVPLVFIMIGIIVGIISLGSLLYVWFGIVGTLLLLAFMLFFLAVFTLSKILASYLFGSWLMRVLFRVEKENIWLNLLLGVFLYVIIRSIPLVGWLAGLAATLIGMGAFWLAFHKKQTA